MASSAVNARIMGFPWTFSVLSPLHQGLCIHHSSFDSPPSQRSISMVVEGSASLRNSQRRHLQSSGFGAVGFLPTICCQDRCFRCWHEGGSHSTEPPYCFLQQTFLHQTSSLIDLCQRVSSDHGGHEKVALVFVGAPLHNIDRPQELKRTHVPSHTNARTTSLLGTPYRL